MSAAYERVKRCAAFVRAKTEFVPRTALVLGSGLGGFGDRVQVQDVVEYRDIPGFPRVHGARPHREGSSSAPWAASLWR